jgi:hypothetical protein
MFKFILKYFTAKLAKHSQKGAKFFSPFCAIFAVRKPAVFLTESHNTLIYFLFLSALQC